jgi:AcrR family transcriptional regulator
MNTKDKIIRSGINILAKKPRSSIEDIARSAGVTRVTVNRHFKSRDFLIGVLEEHCLSSLSEVLVEAREMDDRAINKIKFVISEFIPLYYECLFLTRFSDWDEETFQGDSVYYQQMVAMNDLVKEALADGDLRSDFPADWIVTLMTYSAMAMGDAKEMGSIAPNQATTLALEAFLSGCKAKVYLGR